MAAICRPFSFASVILAVSLYRSFPLSLVLKCVGLTYDKLPLRLSVVCFWHHDLGIWLSHFSADDLSCLGIYAEHQLARFMALLL